MTWTELKEKLADPQIEKSNFYVSLYSRLILLKQKSLPAETKIAFDQLKEKYSEQREAQDAIIEENESSEEDKANESREKGNQKPKVNMNYQVINGIPWSILKHALYDPTFDSADFLVSKKQSANLSYRAN